MIHEEKKVGKIVEELTMFFFSVGGNRMSSEINRNGHEVEIVFRSNYDPEYEHNIHKLEEYFDEPKNEGIEDIYWELAGSGDPGESSQLLLLGMMIDSYKIKITDNEVELHLFKHLLT